MRKKQSAPIPYVHEMADGNGYLVSIPQGPHRLTRQFTVGAGCRQQTRRAAIAYRDKHLSVSQKARVSRAHRSQTKVRQGVVNRKRTSLGKTGLDLVRIRSKGVEGALYVQASAKDSESRKHYYARFSLARYTFSEALTYALRKRLGWEERCYGHQSKLSEADWHLLISEVYAQFGREKISLSMLEHPGRILQHQTGLMAVFSNEGDELSMVFDFKTYSGEHEARAAAIVWLMRSGEKAPRP